MNTINFKPVFWTFLFMTLLSCSNQNITPYNLGVNISCARNETVAIYSQEMIFALIVEVLHISEGRCPSDFYCLLAGQASVEFLAGGNTFTLKIDESKGFIVAGRPFYLKLINVTPYPSSTNWNELKKAVFVVY